MKHSAGSFLFWATIALILVAACNAGADSGYGYAQTSNAVHSNSAPTQDKAPAATADPPDYVGADTCKTCHEDIYNNWEQTPHWKTLNDTRGGPSKQGCEGCHGPGAAHVAGGGDVTKIFIFKNHSAKEIDARCLTCHASGTQHMNAINSEHAKSDVNCISCH